MKQIFIFALVALLGITANAQEIGLVTVRAENPKYVNSQYIDFVKNASPLTKLETMFSGNIKLPSVGTLGGFMVSVEKTTDLTSNLSKKAIVISPNAAAAGNVIKSIMGNSSKESFYFIDESEVDAFIAAIKKMQAFQKNPPTVNTYFTYYCRGGFFVTAGFNAMGKNPVWMAKVAEAGPFTATGKDFDIFTLMIETLEKAKKDMATLK